MLDCDAPFSRSALKGSIGIRSDKYDQIESHEWHPRFLSFLAANGVTIETNVAVEGIDHDGFFKGMKGEEPWCGSAKDVFHVPGLPG